MNSEKKHHPALVLTGALFALLVSAQAQTPPAKADKELPPVTLETYNVSASKTQSYQAESVQMGAFRDLNPVDVPLTVNVVTREAFDAQAARTLFDALKNTAGATRSQLGGAVYDNIAVRGITVENRGNFRLNGSLPIINLIDLSLENKERIEVLKGASSLYYGFVPPSGLVNLTTKRPAPEPLTALTVSANSFGAVNGHLDISRRFGPQDRAGLRLNVAGGNEDLGLDNFKGNRAFFSTAADWKITDHLLLRFDSEYLKKSASEPSIIALNAPVAGVITLPPLPPMSRNYGGEWMRYDASMANYLLRADVLLSSHWTVLFEAGHAKTYRDRLLSILQNVNLTTGAANLSIGFTPSNLYQNTNWRTELFGRFLTGKAQHNLSFGATTNTRAQDQWNLGSFNFAQNYYNPIPVPVIAPPTATAARTTNKIKDTGIYLSDRVTAFEDHLQLIGGMRTTDFVNNNTVFTTNNTTHVTTVAPSNYNVKNELSPMISAAWKPTVNSTLYVSYLKALEAGATAGSAFANNGFTLPPLDSRQYEVGAKAQLGGVLVQLGYYDIERPSTFTDSRNYLTANGKATYRGTELYASGEVMKNLSLIVSGNVLDAKQTNPANVATFGKIPQGTARYTASGFLEWHVPQVKGLAVSGGAFYTGSRPMNDANQAFIGGYTTFTAGFSYRGALAGRTFTVRVNGENIFEKHAWASSNSYLQTTFPRIVKFSLTTNF